MTHAERRRRLEALVLAHRDLWQPQPFKLETPPWCADHPGMSGMLLALPDEAVEHLTGDSAALVRWLTPHLPSVDEAAGLVDLPALPTGTRGEPASAQPRFLNDIPGRKLAQIHAFAASLSRPAGPLLEWCAGKGHLGRLLADTWQVPTTSLEIDAGLCRAGEHLATRLRPPAGQRFLAADVLDPDTHSHLVGHHAVALHACGDLHRELVLATAAHGSPAVTVAPCCYYRCRSERLAPLAGGGLYLGRDDLRLAVTETVTASPRQRRQSRQALAWKLGWVELRKQLTGEPTYRSFPPVPEAWLRADFPTFARHIAARQGVEGLPGDAGLAGFETLGRARAARMRRLQLVRLAFRRALEVWLLLDMAVFLERNGYRVALGPFCPPSLTPRNLLLSARRYN